MLVKACPRCQSVSNIKPSMNSEYAKKGGKRCDWCGYQFHESEEVDIEVPGDEERSRKRVKPDPQPYWFDMPKPS